MAQQQAPGIHQRWAHFRLSVVGHLLAAPPTRGELRSTLRQLAERTWTHPISGAPIRFRFSTLERWLYQARGAGQDPVAALRRKLRSDRGLQPAMTERLKPLLLAQYREHPRWSAQLHIDNLAAQVEQQPDLGPMSSASTLRRFMKKNGLYRRRRLSSKNTAGARAAQARFEEREVRSFEAEYVQGVWHLDYHVCSQQIVTAAGEWVTPVLMGILDDRSRLACHVQWYLEETAENLVHALCQAFLKRRLPRLLVMDNGGPMVAAETQEGLARLGILVQHTLPYSPYQNAKQEIFWAQVEGRLMAMLEHTAELTLALLNEATQAWVEMEYQRKRHTEIGQSPLARYLQGPEVGRDSPDPEALRLAFGMQVKRKSRRSDGTFSLEGRRFEIPSRYRTLEQITVRYARWDLSFVHGVDPATDTILCRLFPLDKTRNADGRRRKVTPGPNTLESSPPASGDMAPLLRKLLADYAVTGLPPAYLVVPEPADADGCDPQQHVDPLPNHPPRSPA